MAKVFCIDVSRCSGCYNCQFACKDEHCSNEWMPYARMQPLMGQFWLKMEEHIQGTKPKLRMHFIPRLCRHCDDPACLKAAEGGAVFKREDGLVIIDPEKAKGQKQIMESCPYGSIYWNGELDIPQKCTGCAHLLAEGKDPRCVDVCHTGAIRFGEEEEFADFISVAVTCDQDRTAGSRVYYKGIPGEFIGGTLYDPEEEETVRGARCILTQGAVALETETDIFGDFWFNDLPAGVYDLRIEARGFKEKSFERISSEGSLNLGDIPMEKIREA